MFRFISVQDFEIRKVMREERRGERGEGRGGERFVGGQEKAAHAALQHKTQKLNMLFEEQYYTLTSYNNARENLATTVAGRARHFPGTTFSLAQEAPGRLT